MIKSKVSVWQMKDECWCRKGSLCHSSLFGVLFKFSSERKSSVCCMWVVSLSDIVQVILSLSDFDGAVLRLAIKIRGNDRPSCEDCATPDQFSPQSTSVVRKNVIVIAPWPRCHNYMFLSKHSHFTFFKTHILCTCLSIICHRADINMITRA